MMMTLLAVNVHILLLAQQGQHGMVPFAMNYWDATQAPSPVDVSFLLEAPAGKHGFIEVKNGHLATSDGQRIRLWGVDITDWSSGSRKIPAKKDADFWATTLTRFGINAVRLQRLDSDAPDGLIKSGTDDSGLLDSGQLDREDYFIAQLERRGIYVDIDLMVARSFRDADGIRDREVLGSGAKGTSLYDPRLIKLQKKYARQLLCHLNPYTKLKYIDDPGVAIIEINNENQLYVGFHAPSPYYEAELISLYNHWLAANVGTKQMAALHALTGTSDNSPIPLLDQQEAHAESQRARFLIESAFYEQLQSKYFSGMRRYIKQVLGAKSLVIGTSDHAHKGSGYPKLLATSSMDIIDGHDYWEHPGDTAIKKKTPMVDDPLQSIVVELSRSAIVGKPYTVSEVNEPLPNDYASEGIPIIAAYGDFQDWDGIFWFTFEPEIDPQAQPAVGNVFDISFDPVKMPELAAGALLFLRGDVDQAREIRERSYSLSQAFVSVLLPQTERPFFTLGFPLTLPLQHEVRMRFIAQSVKPSFDAPGNNNPIVSDTKQLAWYTSPQKGEVTVDSPRSQALIGFIGEHPVHDSNLAVNVRNNFCAIMLSSLDKQPIVTSSRMLLVTGARAENTGETWEVNGTKLANVGRPPTLIEPVLGTLTLKEIYHARAVSLQPIDGAGHALGSAISATAAGDNWSVQLGTVATPWYLITVVR